MIKLLERTGLRPLIAASVLSLSIALFGCVGFAQAADTDALLAEPAHTKVLTPNGDGTYDLSLSVTGDSQSTTTTSKANVIVVADLSNSMDDDVYVKTDDPSGDGYSEHYGLVDGEYKQVYQRTDGSWYYRSWFSSVTYSGDIYYATERLDVGKEAIKLLSKELMPTGNVDVQMGLIGFGTTSSVLQTFTRDQTTFDAAVDAMQVSGGNNGGTNWDDALEHVNQVIAGLEAAGNTDPTYVIFLSDGNPTYYNDANGNVAGTGYSDDYNYCINAAKEESAKIVESIGEDNFYTIGAFGDTQKMASLGGTHHEVSDKQALLDLTERIAASILTEDHFADVKIEDGITDLAATTLADNASDFTYTKNGEAWTDAPAATYADGKVTWDLSSLGKLEKGVTYAVHFKVWPSEEAIDLVTDFTNGDKTWSAEEYPLISKNNDGTYSVQTNVPDSAVLKYKQVTSVDGEDSYSAERTTQYTYPVMPVSAISPVVVGPSGDTTIDVSKVLTGRDWLEGDSFDFKIAGEAGCPMPEKDTISIDDADKNKKASFGDITFKKAGKYVYTITEVKGEIPGISYDSTSYTVVVDVVRDGLNLVPTVSYLKNNVAVEGASFTNTYAVNPTATTIENGLVGTKHLDGATLHNGDFRFQSEALNGAIAPAAPSVVNNGVGDEPSVIDFGNIVFTKAGDYSYKVWEINDGKTGYTYDNSEYIVTFHVTEDQKTAQLSFTRTIQKDGQTVDEIAFNNKYQANPVSTVPALGGKKTVNATGTTWTMETGQFSFALIDRQGKKAQEVGNKADGTFTFGQLKFTEPGTYLYTVTEVEGTLPGVSYDPAVYTLEFVVEDNAGNLEITSQSVVKTDGSTGIALDQLNFTNTYAPSDVTVTLAGTKAYVNTDTGTNRVIQDGECEFALTNEQGEVIDTTKNVSKGFTFKPITYNGEGAWVYYMYEIKGNDPTIEYDANKYKLTVTVTHDQNTGALVATVEDEDDDSLPINFVNKYTPTKVVVGPSGDASIHGVKVLQGRDGQPLSAGEFSFVLSDDKGNRVDTQSNDARGEFTFKDIEFTKTGEYMYYVSEVGHGSVKDGITYSKELYGVLVTVTENPDTHKLEASVQATKGGTDAGTADELIVFTNTYSADPVIVDTKTDANIQLNKVLNGRDWLSSDKFTFTLAGQDNAPMPEKDTVDVTASAKDGEAVPFDFGTITYDKAGVYKYTVSEENAGKVINGITYSTNVANITVTVTDNNQGKLVASVSAENSSFVNSYAVKPVTLSGEDGLYATKQLEGKTLQAGEFEFQAQEHADGVSTEPSSVKNGNGNDPAPVIFPAVSFTKAGTYKYLLQELNGHKAGYTYDDTEYLVTFVVTEDQAAGKLNVTRTIENADNGEKYDAAVFKNKYKPEPVTTEDANINLTGKKTVTADTAEWTMAEGQFTFQLKDADGKTVQTVKNAADGSFALDKLTFTEPGTYTYTLAEEPGSQKGMSYDGQVYTLTFEVTDEQGKLTISSSSVTTTAGAATSFDQMNFDNTYDPENVKVALSGTKILASTDGGAVRNIADGEFSFQLKDKDGKVLQTVSNVGTAFGFDAIEYDKPGTYTYSVAEVAGSDGTITYDTAVQTVKVVVTDNDGVLSAKVTYPSKDGITFTNSYTPTPVIVGPSGTATISGSKTLEGRDVKALEKGEFKFQLIDANGKVVDTASNDANGNFTFGDITFKKTGIYTYQVMEKGAGTTQDGVTYSTESYSVVITVTEDADNHKLKADVAISGDRDKVDTMSFTNTYKANATSVALGAAKSLKGKDLTDGQFSFELADEAGTVIETVKNTASGAVKFSDLTYDAAGTYKYTISEVNDAQEHMTYDDSVHEAVVEVTDDGSGNLKTKVTYDGLESAPTFTNTYTEPQPDDPNKGDKPKKPEDNTIPTTNDSNNLTLVAIGGILAAIVAGGILVKRRFFK